MWHRLRVIVLGVAFLALLIEPSLHAGGGPSHHWTGWSRRKSFSPIDVAGSVLWLNAARNVTNVSGAASAWSSIIGTYSTAQATAGKRPTIGTGINGRATLLFTTASAQELVNTTDNLVASGAARYVLIVAKATSPGGALLTFRSGTVGGTAPAWALMTTVQAGIMYYYTDSVANSLNDGSIPAAYTSAHVIEYELEASQAGVVRINGLTRTSSGGTVNAETGSTGFRIGSTAAPNAYYEGHIADIYVAAPIPSAADRAKLRAYFALINGITL